MASMPNTGVEEEYYRLRHFSITGKGVVNRGDSLKSRRSRSNNSVASSNSRYVKLVIGKHLNGYRDFKTIQLLPAAFYKSSFKSFIEIVYFLILINFYKDERFKRRKYKFVFVRANLKENYMKISFFYSYI